MNSAHNSASSALDKQLRDKSTGRETGIRYKPERFGDQNYTKTKLESELSVVAANNYIPLTDAQIKKHENLIDEKAKDTIPALARTTLTFSELSTIARRLVTQKVGMSDKIEELAKNAALNRWVKDGKYHHQNAREKCAFCGNTISEDRWAQLDKHFDEESDKLEKDIDALLSKIKNEEQAVAAGFNIDSSLFYKEFHPKLEELTVEFQEHSKGYIDALKELATQLESRKADIINTQKYKEPTCNIETLKTVWHSYDELRNESNSSTGSLTEKQEKSRKALRLHEVHCFATTINYSEQTAKIKELATDLESKKNSGKNISDSIQEKLSLIEAKKREMNDEEKGALKVNEYLNHYFGNRFLSLEAKNVEGYETENTRVHFRVMRDGKKAYHLSEGECSLLAFCYFLAKLDDTETRGTKPIIWIDDPISSLDGNHIFFVYSLLAAELVEVNAFTQLFVSTHNLEFLKFLKRLTGKFTNHNGRQQELERQFLIIERQDKKSIIKMMPDYLKEYATEFNYLFHQIYKCAQIDSIDDSNYHVFYNFGNHARKFLEIYLYYKFPNSHRENNGELGAKLQQFFGEERIPAILTNRINNEYSHLCGVIERGSTPVEVPEMKAAANAILARLRMDTGQFNAFLESIGVEPEETESYPS